MPSVEERIATLPIWSGRPALEPLSGGISNISFAVSDNSGRYVARIARDFPFHHVFREREVMTTRAAHAAGFGPELVHAEPGVMVTRFIPDGRPLTAEDVRRHVPRVAEFLRRFHVGMAEHLSGAGFMFWPFHVNRDYLRQLRDAGSSGTDLARWRTINAALEAFQPALPIIVGHHDVLPGNWIDDGRRLWLIDYEYAGFGTPMFDLANLSSNAEFTAAQNAALLEAYFDRSTAELARAHAAMEAASLLREGLWSLVSAIHLEHPDFDYRAYAARNFDRLEAALATMDLSA